MMWVRASPALSSPALFTALQPADPCSAPAGCVCVCCPLQHAMCDVSRTGTGARGLRCAMLPWGGPTSTDGRGSFLACCLLRVACCMLSAASCLLLAACCLLHVICCMLRAACCVLLHVVCCVLHVVCCMLHAAYCMLSVACCMLRVAWCCLLRVVCCMLHVAGSAADCADQSVVSVRAALAAAAQRVRAPTKRIRVYSRCASVRACGFAFACMRACVASAMDGIPCRFG